MSIEIATISGNTSAISEPAVAPAPRERAEYDQQLANDIAAAGTLLTKTLASPSVVAELSYSNSELDAGVALQKDAQDTFTARQAAISTLGNALSARDALLASIKQDFMAFRQTVQANFDGAERTALAASGKVPIDVQKLATLLRSAYETARQSPYTEVLTKRKFAPAALDVQLLQLDELERLDGAYHAAEQGAIVATSVRNEAGKKLRTWISRFKKQARADLRKHADLLAELGLAAR